MGINPVEKVIEQPPQFLTPFSFQSSSLPLTFFFPSYCLEAYTPFPLLPTLYCPVFPTKDLRNGTRDPGLQPTEGVSSSCLFVYSSQGHVWFLIVYSGADSIGHWGHVSPFLQMAWHRGHREKKNSKQETDDTAHWPSRKRSPKRLIVGLHVNKTRSGGARPKISGDSCQTCTPSLFSNSFRCHLFLILF